MGFKFNPFIGNFDNVGGESPFFLPPVADRASLPSGDPDGAVRVVLDEDSVFQYDNGSDTWHNTRLTLTQFTAVANAAGVTIDTSTTAGTPNVTDYQIILHAADSTNPGGVSTAAQTFAGDKTFNNNVTVQGDLTVNGTETILNTQTIESEDTNILLNKNGNDASAEGGGITISRTGVNGSLTYEDALASKFKIGTLGSEIEIADVSSLQTITNKTIDADNNTISNLEHGAEVDDPSSNVHGVTGNVVGTTDAQTLTNKTIDADLNAISNLEHGAEVDDPSSGVHGVTGNIVGDTDAQTLTNKTIDADNNIITNLAHGAEVNDPSSGVHGVTGTIVGDSDTQTLTNKTIDADLNTITNIENANIKAAAAIDASKLADGSVSNTELQQINSLTSNAQDQLDARVVGPGSATDNALARYDLATGKLIQDSLVILDDAGAMSGLTQLDVDNIQINGNTISSTDSAGDINLVADTTAGGGAGGVVLNNLSSATAGSQPFYPNQSGQVFTTSTGGLLSTLEVAMNVSAAQWIYTKIYNTSGGLPTGSPIATSTAVQTNAGDGDITYTFTFAGAEPLPVGTYAWIVTGVTDGTATTEVNISSSIRPRLDGGANSVAGAGVYDSNATVGVDSWVALGDDRCARLTLSPAPASQGTIVLDGDEIDASTSKIINVVDPTADQDAATKKYVDDNEPVLDEDILQGTFSLAQSQTGSNVTGLAFTNGATRSARVQYSVVIDATSDLYEVGTLEIIQRGADWTIAQESSGDDSLLSFNVTAAGQITYDSPAYAGFTSGTMKFRATTTEV